MSETQTALKAPRDLDDHQPWLAQAETVVRTRFGYPSLRPHQAAVLTHVMAGQDCLAVLPTGSGKTLCYALPSLLRPGLVMVVSPLIALIRDQARKFQDLGIRCNFLDSHQTSLEKEEALADLMGGESQILLVSPERLARDGFRQRLRSLPLQLVAIDEAHCISQWGAHFRPDYRRLGTYLEDFPGVQKLAVTATATAGVRKDIAKTLALTSPQEVWGDLARANLHIRVVKMGKVAEQLTAVLQAVQNARGPGIVYAPTRKSATEITQMLRNGGIKAGLYHAGLSPAERHHCQTAFMEGKIPVVVATNAFGLGIDKANIRFVHHAGLPGSLEQYVQEIGRAGRDGLPAGCTLIYGPRDYHIQKFMIDRSFPDPMLMKRALRECRSFVTGPMGQSLATVIRHLRTELRTEPGLIEQMMDILCREGLLLRWRAHSSSTATDYYDEMIAEGAPRDGEFLADYPLRKEAELAKLDAMRLFATQGVDRLRFLDSYFRKGP